MNISELVASIVPFPANNIFYLILIGISLFLGAKLIDVIPGVKDNGLLWLIISGALFYLLGYF